MTEQEAFELFRNGWHRRRLAQAYVLIGSLQGAALALARRVLGLLFCEEAEPPCGRCRGCRQAQARTHPDLIWMEPEKTSRIIGVESVRDLLRHMAQSSFGGGWKAAVLYAADRLSASSSNAFLKLLEEPPPQTLFLLLTDSPQFLLPTVISRCQRVAITGDSARLPAAWREQAMSILQDAGKVGPITAMALAQRMMRLLGEIKEQVAGEVREESGQSDVDDEKSTLDARVNARYKELRKEVILLALSWYRDILLTTAGVTDEGVFEHGDCREAIVRKAASLTPVQAQENVRIVENMNRLLERNVSEGMALALSFGALR